MSEYRRGSGFVWALVALLVVALAVQSYYLYETNRQIRNAIAQNNGIPGMMAPGAVPGMQAPSSTTATPLIPQTWNPSAEMAALRQHMDELFNSTLAHFQSSPQAASQAAELPVNPAINLSESKDHYTVTMRVPSSEASNVNVTTQGQALKVTGEHKVQKQNKEPGGQVEQEAISTAFQDTVQLPGPVAANSVHTDYQNGMLTITVQKAA
jgi:HSP20 family protein